MSQVDMSRIDNVAEALARLNPEGVSFSREDLAALCESADDAGPFTDAEKVRIARLLATSSNWDAA